MKADLKITAALRAADIRAGLHHLHEDGSLTLMNPLRF